MYNTKHHKQPLQAWLMKQAESKGTRITTYKEKFAKKVGITLVFLNQIISGRAHPSWPGVAEKISQATNGVVGVGDLRPDVFKAIVNDKGLVLAVRKAVRATKGKG